MKPLRRLLDSVEPAFGEGGRLARFHALYEAIDTFFYSPGAVTKGAPHLRDSMDLKRIADAWNLRSSRSIIHMPPTARY